jgi:hypothetical protein
VAVKTAYKKAKQAVEAAKLAAATEGMKPFELYGNLLSDEARQPWEKIIQAQMTKCPWEDIFGVTHDKKNYQDLGLLHGVHHIPPSAGVQA